MNYNQGDTLYPPAHIESGNWVAAADWALVRMSDGFFLDFFDDVFKAAGWTTQHQSLTDTTTSRWHDLTGVVLAAANEQYQIFYREDAGEYIGGERFFVRDDLLIGTVTTNTDMRGTNSAATAASLATAQTDLDTLTGADGVTLATSQLNYAPNTVVPDAAGVAPTAAEIRQEMDTNSADLNTLVTNVASILTDTAEIGAAGAGLTALAQASVVTETRLSELDAATAGKMANQIDIVQTDTTTDIPASIAALNDVAATDIVSSGAITTLAGAVANVDLVDVTTTNTDMRGTESAATATALATAQTDLDTLTGTDGATLATSQLNYAPNTVVPDAAGVAPTAAEIRQEMDTNSVDLNTIAADVAAILTDTAEIGAAGAGLTDLGGMSVAMKAQVNAEALDVLVTDTFAELSGVPAATASLADKIAWICMQARNKTTQTSTTQLVLADDGTTTVGTSAVSDDGTTATRAEYV